MVTGIYSNIFLADEAVTFHTYKMVWARTHLEFYVDGHKVFWVDEHGKIPHLPLQLVMNVAVAGPFALHEPRNDTARAKDVYMMIDYVVVRQNWTAQLGGRNGSVNARKNDGVEAASSVPGPVPGYVGLAIGLLTGALLMVIMMGALFFYKCRQHDRVIPRDSRRESLVSNPEF